MDKIIKGSCHSCLYRHRFCRHEVMLENNCKHWKIGKCYTCKFIDETDDNEWLKRGCETECFGGCKKYKRDWKKTFQVIKMKF